MDQSATITVGTYNLLHPVYAEKYRQKEGINRKSNDSNWATRVPYIGALLQHARLDFYLLQEVGQEEMTDLLPYLNDYEISHYIHPTRTAQDGVAVLGRKDKWKLIKKEMIPFQFKFDALDDHERKAIMSNDKKEYMCSIAAWFTSKSKNKFMGEKTPNKFQRVIVASTHFYEKKTKNPQATLLKFLNECENSQNSECIDLVIWGGDLNRQYYEKKISDNRQIKRKIRKKYHQSFVIKRCFPIPNRYLCAPGRDVTRYKKKIDWIFCKNVNSKCFDVKIDNVLVDANDNKQSCTYTNVCKAFIQSTKQRIPSTGFPPSDHFADAVFIRMKKISSQK